MSKASLVCLRRPVFYIATLGRQGDARAMVPYAFARLLGRRAGSGHEHVLPWYGTRRSGEALPTPICAAAVIWFCVRSSALLLLGSSTVLTS